MSSNSPTRITQLMEDVVAYSTEHVRGGGIPFAAFVVNATGRFLGAALIAFETIMIRPHMLRSKPYEMRTVMLDQSIYMERRSWHLVSPVPCVI